MTERDLPQEALEALQHVINTYIAPRRIDWTDLGYAEQARIDLSVILDALEHDKSTWEARGS